MVSAGLLAYGSSYWPGLPILSDSGVFPVFVPDYSGGSATVSHRLPFYGPFGPPKSSIFTCQCIRTLINILPSYIKSSLKNNIFWNRRLTPMHADIFHNYRVGNPFSDSASPGRFFEQRQ
jgi:hypothetical protein